MMQNEKNQVIPAEDNELFEEPLSETKLSPTNWKGLQLQSAISFFILQLLVITQLRVQ